MARRATQRRTLGLESLEKREVLSGMTAEKVYMLEWVNLARTNPTAAIDRAAAKLDDSTRQTLQFYGVDIEQAKREVSAIAPQQPLAYSDQLDHAAQDHSQDMLNTGVQSHNGSDGSDLGTRLNRVGYSNRGNISENAYAYADSVDNAMQAFLFDWGVANKGHRANLTQPGANADQSFNEVGFGIANANRPGFGPKVVTQNFGHRNNTKARLVGVAYTDRDRDQFYTPGEGAGGLTIDAVNVATGQDVAGQTGDAGDYQIALDPGRYNVAAKINGRAVQTQTVDIGTQNVHANFVLNNPVSTPVVTAAPVVVPVVTPPPVVTIRTTRATPVISAAPTLNLSAVNMISNATQVAPFNTTPTPVVTPVATPTPVVIPVATTPPVVTPPTATPTPQRPTVTVSIPIVTTPAPAKVADPNTLDALFGSTPVTGWTVFKATRS